MAGAKVSAFRIQIGDTIRTKIRIDRANYLQQSADSTRSDTDCIVEAWKIHRDRWYWFGWRKRRQRLPNDARSSHRRSVDLLRLPLNTNFAFKRGYDANIFGVLSEIPERYSDILFPIFDSQISRKKQILNRRSDLLWNEFITFKRKYLIYKFNYIYLYYFISVSWMIRFFV